MLAGYMYYTIAEIELNGRKVSLLLLHDDDELRKEMQERECVAKAS